MSTEHKEMNNKDYKDKFEADIAKEIANLGKIIHDKFPDSWKNYSSLKDDYPNIYKFFAYRITEEGLKIDCDVTEEGLTKLLTLAKKQNNQKFSNTEVTKQCRNEKFKHKFQITSKDNDILYRGDTISSFWTTFITFMQVSLFSELNLKKQGKKKIVVGNKNTLLYCTTVR